MLKLFIPLFLAIFVCQAQADTKVQAESQDLQMVQEESEKNADMSCTGYHKYNNGSRFVTDDIPLEVGDPTSENGGFEDANIKKVVADFAQVHLYAKWDKRDNQVNFIISFGPTYEESFASESIVKENSKATFTHISAENIYQIICWLKN